MSVTLLSPSLPSPSRLRGRDLRCQLDVDPKVPSFRPFLSREASLFPLHRRRARQQIIFSFLLFTRNGQRCRFVTPLNNLHLASRSSEQLRDFARCMRLTMGHIVFRGRERLSYFPAIGGGREEGALQRISEVGQNAASFPVVEG